ncbi:BREX-2 system adenine-specific DNA-methyltransferase PglX [Streptomyces cinereoruber]|uniref:BREX-2 system adenine-specific DNA-methyltransferase PglX n=1 Tax=Streptomyces cinereoruber TaxID=67260 RepID=UPI00362D40C7
MIDRKALLDDLKQQVKAVEADLGKQVKVVPEGARLRDEYDRARKLGRTAATWNSWLDERITQVAVAWVLGSVFVRFCEDNGLIPEPYLTAPGADRRDLALARYEDYLSTSDDPTYRGWLERAFEELGAGQAGRLLFDRRHNPLYQIPLSHDGARELVEFWRARDESGVLVHDFTDPLNEDGTEGWDTRFLGDLYQDLSEAARKTYALLQTPEFVEEFILDRTMDPAIREFGYEGLKMIDPTCGSGHFVLGAFRRLVRLWGEGQPGKDLHERVRAALDSVHGVDLNPFAVAIARFRLLVAAMAASGVRSLGEAARYEWPIHLAVGDSLIKHRHRQESLFEGDGSEGSDELADFKYQTEDVHEHPDILKPGRYHVVVGNPPYVTVKDKKLNELYRQLYRDVCSGKYALSVPFAQRFFELAKIGESESGRGYGMVGQITANSFMKREFGTRLIELYFGHEVELTEVIDTSGAYIPGHGTPTVILVGKQRGGINRSQTIRVVRSIQGEPSAPSEGEEGKVWRAIVAQIEEPGSVSHWVSVDDLDRDRHFSKQPWVLANGGLEMLERISLSTQASLKQEVTRIGFYGIPGSDDAMTATRHAFRRAKTEEAYIRNLVVGDEVRDFDFIDGDIVFHPYDTKRNLQHLNNFPQLGRWLWASRTELGSRATFSGGTYFTDGRPWWEWHQIPKDSKSHKWSISFAFVTTHNHFALDRDGRVFKQSAPLIKLREEASEEEHLRLLGLLNSSTACFWLKMVSHNKGSTVDIKGARQSTIPFEDFYEFTGTKLQDFPLPDTYPTSLAIALDGLAQKLSATNPSTLIAKTNPTSMKLREACDSWLSVRSWMIALQEELDWQVYSLYGLHSEDLRVSENLDSSEIPKLALGERAFEIVLARRVAAGEASDEWFKRHGSTPITEIPTHWPAAYCEVVQKRIDAIESSRAIGMVERPEYKRRWATEGWDALQEKALRSWLLDRIEDRDHWFDENGMPALITLSRLIDNLSRDENFVSIAKIYAPRKELPAVVAELMTNEHVPFLSTLRYKPAGLKKRADWEHVWDLQRQEDAAEDEPAKRKIRDSIPVPPKYTSADFLRPSYWRARGKLDVPKERFISYGQANVPTPDLYGWAGWDHQEQAYALTTYIATHESLTTEEVTPFLAGLLELQPWLDQWHDEFDATFGSSPAAFFRGDRQMEQGKHGLTDDDLRAWRPAAATRGRRTTKK